MSDKTLVILYSVVFDDFPGWEQFDHAVLLLGKSFSLFNLLSRSISVEGTNGLLDPALSIAVDKITWAAFTIWPLVLLNRPKRVMNHTFGCFFTLLQPPRTSPPSTSCNRAFDCSVLSLYHLSYSRPRPSATLTLRDPSRLPWGRPFLPCLLLVPQVRCCSWLVVSLCSYHTILFISHRPQNQLRLFTLEP
jgi:hypothetical protein